MRLLLHLWRTNVACTAELRQTVRLARPSFGERHQAETRHGSRRRLRQRLIADDQQRFDLRKTTD